jgi:L-fuconolactonase
VSSPPHIDSHQHFWSVARTDYGWLTPALPGLYRDFLPDDLLPLLTSAGITQTVLVQAAPTVAETRYLLDLAQRTSFVAAVVGWIDMRAADAPEAIARLATQPRFRGIRPMLQDIPDVEWIRDPQLEPAFTALIEHGLSFDALVRPAYLPALLAVMQRHPMLPVVIDHGAKPNIAARQHDDWARQMRAIARDSTACCKISGLVTEAAPGVSFDVIRPYLDVLFECFGPTRLMWGSDWPVVNLACDYLAWWEMMQRYLEQIDPSGREAVLGGTAARFYRVGERL